MSKKVYIRQPVYLPGLVFFDALLQVDVYIIYDNVQYERRHWGNRNKILTSKGPIWLTVPVIQKGKFDQTYQETKIDNSTQWGKNHWKSISLNYAKAPYFKKYSDFFEDLYSKTFTKLLDLDIVIIDYLKKQLGIEIEILISSQLQLPDNVANKTDRLVKMIKKVGGDVYITSKGTKNYMDEKLMSKHDIKLLWHDFNHPTYKQFHGEFIPFMSTIDLLFNYGEKSKSIIRDNLKPALSIYNS